MTRWSSLPNLRERARWDTLELGSLVRSSNPRNVVMILYFA